MARVGLSERDALPANLRPIHDAMSTYGPFGSLVGAMGNRPPILEHVFGLLTALRDEDVLPRRYLELALVAVSQLNACEYCVSHHAPMLEVIGVSPKGVDTLLDFENHPELDDVDKLVVEYAREVTLNPNTVRDGMFDRLHEHFDDAQIVELTWRIAMCGAFNRFNDVLQLDIEESVLRRSA